MLVNFLSARGVKLCKKFRLGERGELEVEPYPFVKRFSSISFPVKDLESFHRKLVDHASKGHSLLKGTLTRQLEDESRAGATSPLTPTEYIVLDYDREGGFEDFDELLDAIGLGGVDYIFQHSASAGIKDKIGLRGHAFILLDEPVVPPRLKNWLKHLNLTVEPLCKQLELSASGLALRYPLDVTTCQNDKIIYIADPELEGLTDPLAGQRFELRRRGQERASLDLLEVPPNTDALVEKRVNALRKERGLPKRQPRYVHVGGVEVLKNPDKAIVTGEKRARGFVYLNLNNGDSWGYYYPEGKPEILYNFKGEPAVRLRDIAPDYYKHVVSEALRPERRIRERFAFYVLDLDTYFIGDYDGTLCQVTPVAKQNLGTALANAGVDLPDPIPEWRIGFDPTNSVLFNRAERWINLWTPTFYIQKAREKQDAKVPELIARVIRSVTGGEEEAYQHFLNWLAFKFQTRRKTQTAWLFHGTTGTGKGTLFYKILVPLFGESHCVRLSMKNLSDMFNPDLERALFVFIDEAKFVERERRLLDELKGLITENTLQIRAMRQARVERPNFTSVIVATNHADPLPLEANDRRFNVCYSPEKLQMTAKEYNFGFGRSALQQFADFLQSFEVDESRVHVPLDNDARRRLIQASEPSTDVFFRALRTGNLDLLMQALHPGLAPDPADYMAAGRFNKARQVLAKWIKHLITNGVLAYVPIREVMDVYLGATGASRTSLFKFTRQLMLHGVEVHGEDVLVGIQAIALDKMKEFLDGCNRGAPSGDKEGKKGAVNVGS